MRWRADEPVAPTPLDRRPGEVRLLVPADPDPAGGLWVYRPDEHTMSHLGRDKAVPLPPAARAVPEPWLAGNRPDEVVFRPRQAREEMYADGRGRRTSKGTPPQACRRKPADRHRKTWTAVFTDSGYAAGGRRACVRAGVTPWTPGQLRHGFATGVRARFGREAARVSPGHKRADVTQVYAGATLAKAVEAARALGAARYRGARRVPPRALLWVTPAAAYPAVPAGHAPRSGEVGPARRADCYEPPECTEARPDPARSAVRGNPDPGRPGPAYPYLKCRQRGRFRRPPVTKIRVLLADDHAVVRAGIRAVVAAEADMGVVGEAADGPAAAALAAALDPDVVVADQSLPGMSGVELTTRLVAETPARKVPAAGRLAGVVRGAPLLGADDGRVVVIDPATLGVDFNPLPDLIRITSDTGQSLRASPTAGTVAGTDAAPFFEPTNDAANGFTNPAFFDANADGDFDPGTNPPTLPDPEVTGAGYTRNPGAAAGTFVTTLYGIDSANDPLVRLGGPDGGAPRCSAGRRCCSPARRPGQPLGRDLAPGAVREHPGAGRPERPLGRVGGERLGVAPLAPPEVGRVRVRHVERPRPVRVV